MSHIPVLLNEVLSMLAPDPNSVHRMIDGTVGAGGHTRAFLERGAHQILGLDLDTNALAIAESNLQEYMDQVHLRHASYTDMKTEAQRIGWGQVDAILVDLGVSSMQLDIPERGFAFRHDGPLDMRFDPTSDRVMAADIINHWDAGELAKIFSTYGEERYARGIANKIVANRPFSSTSQLADFIEKSVPHNRRKQGTVIHPATRIFQALRITVNDELQSIQKMIPPAIDLLRSGGRLGIISFHSLEDRIVKQAFREAATAIVAPPGMASIKEKPAQIQVLTRKPIVATDAEIRQNPRSRSAKLRIAEKL